MKRKNLEGVYDDFSSFPFYPSPRKSRRLNCELVPIDEDEMLTSSSSSMVEKDDAEIIEAADSIGDRLGDDRALVHFYPNNYAPILRPITGPGFSVIVNSILIPSINGHVFRPSELNNSLIQVMMKEFPTQSNNADQNRRLGVAPWFEPQKQQQYYWLQVQETGPSLMPMDTEESDSDMMETDNAITNYSVQEFQFDEFRSHLHQSMMPHFQQNTLTHITW